MEEINEEMLEHMVFNLKEAKEQLEEIIKELEEDPECSTAGLIVSVAHMYEHLNTAWNIKSLDSKRQDPYTMSSEEDDQKWRQFPQDITDWLL